MEGHTIVKENIHFLTEFPWGDFTSSLRVKYSSGIFESHANMMVDIQSGKILAIASGVKVFENMEVLQIKIKKEISIGLSLSIESMSGPLCEEARKVIRYSVHKFKKN